MGARAAAAGVFIGVAGISTAIGIPHTAERFDHNKYDKGTVMYALGAAASSAVHGTNSAIEKVKDQSDSGSFGGNGGNAGSGTKTSPVKPIPAKQGSFEGPKYPLTATTYSLTAIEHKYQKQQLSINNLLSQSAMHWVAPAKNSKCQKAWDGEKTVRSDSNNSSQFFCWPKDMYGINWRMEGIGGSSTMLDNDGSAHPLSKKNIIVVSMATNNNEKGLVIPIKKHQQTSRLVFFDVDTGQAQIVQLVQPDSSADRIGNLDTHAGGVAMLGNKAIIADSRGMSEFDLTKIFKKDGKMFMPVMKRWRVTSHGLKAGQGVADSLSVDRTVTPNQIVSVGWMNKSVGHSFVYKWNLNDEGTDLAAAASSGKQVEKPASITKNKLHDVQGCVSYYGRMILSTSRDEVYYKDKHGKRKHKMASKLFWWDAKSDQSKSFRSDKKNYSSIRFPERDNQSLYLDTIRGKIWSVNENPPFGYSYTSNISFVHNVPLDITNS